MDVFKKISFAGAMRWLALTCIWGLGINFALTILQVPGRQSRLPAWDMAAHGLDGVLLADAARHFDLLRFLRLFFSMSYWPPVYPLVESLFFGLFGYEFTVARNLELALGVASTVLLFFVGDKLVSRHSWMIGLWSAVFFVTSPGTQLFSTLTMLEVPGIFLTLLALLLFCRYLQDPRPKTFKPVALLTLLLFLTKYNYGIMWLIPFLTWLVATTPALRNWLWLVSKRTLAQISFRSPFLWFCVVYLIFLAYVQLSGGWNFEWRGYKVELESAYGNPIYILLVLVLLNTALFHRAWWHLFRKEFGAAPFQAQIFAIWTVAPIAVWFINPVNFQTFFSSILNQSKRDTFWSLETLTFYPEALIDTFSPSPSVGWLVIVGLALSAIFWRRGSLCLRFLYSLAAFHFFACVIHPNYIDRYLLTALPLIWLSAASGFYLCLQYFFERGTFQRAIIFTVGFAAPLCLFVGFTPSTEPVKEAFEEATVDPHLAPFLLQLCTHAKDANRTAVLGFTYELSPSLVHWYCLLKARDLRIEQIPQTLTRHHLKIERNAPSKIIGGGKIDQFIFIERTGEDEDLTDESYEGLYWQRLYDEISHHPAFSQRAQYDSMIGNYRMRVFRK